MHIYTLFENSLVGKFFCALNLRIVMQEWLDYSSSCACHSPILTYVFPQSLVTGVPLDEVICIRLL